MELGDEVWVRHPTELWIRGTILKKQTAPDWSLTIGLVNGEKKRVRTEGFVQTDDVKLCNVVKDEADAAADAAAGGEGGSGGTVSTGGKGKERDSRDVARSSGIGKFIRWPAWPRKIARPRPSPIA